MKKFLLIPLLFCFLAPVFSQAIVDTLKVFSPSMNKEVKSVIVLPENYTPKKLYPVVYLLHGYSDNYSKWVRTVPSIKALASRFEMIIVCPDGAFSSWYVDSPFDPAFQYETYITKELREYVEKEYSALKNRENRAITGLSMGGHGALVLAMRNKHLYAHAGSMSGVTDLMTLDRDLDLTKRLGKKEENTERWKKHSAFYLAEDLKNGELNLSIECGTGDFLFGANQQFHQKLTELKIDHDYTVRPGVHNWDYWTNAIEYQLLFFNRAFKR
ncbi:MAG: alpha/beta hydrolase family protein [Paludibacter sp.]|jgi:S-formylglutathione hydrolase FrmB|nr:alpha/beta hydrolase family protein [Paludibacter sp.]